MIITISMISTSAFAESTIEVHTSSEEIKALDSIVISGKITDVSQFKPVKLWVIGPEGVRVFAPQVSIEDNGEFRKLLNTPVPSFAEGTYMVTASHEDTKSVAQTQFTVTYQEIPRNPMAQTITETTVAREVERPTSTGVIDISADAIEGSDTITITGNTGLRGSDITLTVKSPIGNMVTIAQVTPGVYGNFEIEIKTGGSMWKEDGMYTVTASQGNSSELKESIQVEIKDGVVVPEFGVIATLILAISIISIIIVSTKTRLSALPRYWFQRKENTMFDLEQIKSEKYISLETYRKNNQAVRTPVWFVIKNNLIIIVTRDQTGKIKRLRNNQKVKIATCSIKGKTSMSMIPGTAQILTAEETTKAVKLRDKKYWFFSRVAKFLTKGKGNLVAVSVKIG
jgi:PPOX class probable F420-dependent enzyme